MLLRMHVHRRRKVRETLAIPTPLFVLTIEDVMPPYAP